MNTMPEVLFVCTHNAGRSQMAAGFARRLAATGSEVLRRVRTGASRTPPPSPRWPSSASTSPRVPQDAGHRESPGRRHRDHDGLRRRLPGLPRHVVPGLGAARPGRAPGRAGPTHPRPDQRAGPRAAHRTRRLTVRAWFSAATTVSSRASRGPFSSRDVFPGVQRVVGTTSFSSASFMPARRPGISAAGKTAARSPA